MQSTYGIKKILLSFSLNVLALFLYVHNKIKNKENMKLYGCYNLCILLQIMILIFKLDKVATYKIETAHIIIWITKLFAFFILVRKKSMLQWRLRHVQCNDYAISTYEAVLYRCFTVITPCFTLSVTWEGVSQTIKT